MGTAAHSTRACWTARASASLCFRSPSDALWYPLAGPYRFVLDETVPLAKALNRFSLVQIHVDVPKRTHAALCPRARAKAGRRQRQ
jgi:hypothetical protein